jgi:peptidyl-prolyl cis-trans isomerase C
LRYCAAQAQSQAQPATEDAVVATIDGKEIRMSDVELAFQGLPAQYRNLPLPMVFGALLQQLIDRQLVADAAEASEIQDEPEVAKRLALARQSVLQQAYLSRRVEPALTEEKLRARYETDVASKPGAEEISARHILVASEEEARTVLKALREGADFAEEAKAKSIGPSGPRGGDLGFFKAEDMVPEFSQAAFALKAGEVSEPVKTEFGWHIIRVDERRAQPAPSFEDSVDELRQTVAQEEVAKIMEGLREKADIKTFNPDGTPQVTPGTAAPKQ